MMRMFRKSDEGFTLVELMVVVLIIGILVAIAIPVFNAASASARKRTCHSNQRIIEGAVQQYLAADPAYRVADVAGLVQSDASPLVPEYIKDVPKCPKPGTTAATTFYSVDASGSTDCPSDVEDHGQYSQP